MSEASRRRTAHLQGVGVATTGEAGLIDRSGIELVEAAFISSAQPAGTSKRKCKYQADSCDGYACPLAHACEPLDAADHARWMGDNEAARELHYPVKPTNPKDRAATNRLDLSLPPDTAVAYMALGFVEGDAKYGGYNWRKAGVLASVYIAAARRHLAKWANGQESDPKTGVPHLASVLACVAILVDAAECGVLRDDRPPAAPVAELLDRFEGIVSKLHELFPNGPARHTL